MVNNHFKDQLLDKFQKSHQIKLELFSDLKKINSFAILMYKTLKKGNKIIFCGNGGSASDAQHLSTEFLIRFDKKYNRKSLPAIALGLDVATLTACANDFSFKHVFSRPFESLAKKGDLLVCLSTSGNSENIVEVLKRSQKAKISCFSFLGNTGGKAKNYSDNFIIVPSKNTALIQETHMFLAHYIIEFVEKTLKNDKEKFK
jgi:D-sedoheptulose 7-phosphate isomerase